MKSYKGTTCFEYELERYQNKKTGTYLTLDEVKSMARGNEEEWIDENFRYVTVTVNVEGRSYFTPGYLSGPPEDCYPDEGETEITSVTLYGKEKEDWEDKLTSSERDYIMDMISEYSMDNYFGDPDDEIY